MKWFCVEEKAKILINDLMKQDVAEVVLDPTLLLSADEWHTILEQHKKRKLDQSFIFCYFLGDLTEKSRSSYIKCEFNIGHYYEACSNGYAAIYLDELEKIMNYKKENLKDSTLNNTAILLVFAYFRHKIRRRPNELMPEERTSDGIKKRKEKLPDAYSGNINDIANELNISSKTLSKIIDILEQELELIVTDRAYRIKNEDDEFRTLPTVFANAYKREDKYLLDTGDNYSRTEIKLKAENMKRHYQGYEIDKRKRKRKIKRKETSVDE